MRIQGWIRVAAVVVAAVWGMGLSFARDLSFEQRVKAQEAIERVYYAHQIGATKPFEKAVPRSLLEAKVRKYLKQTAALEKFWQTPVTDEALGRELERMAAGSRMPERLIELYAALGNDAFLIKECLARQVLVDRLSRNFYAFDATLHEPARLRAEQIHKDLSTGRLDPAQGHPERTVVELGVRAPGAQGEAVERPEVRPGAPLRHTLDPAEYRKQRARWPTVAGAASNVEEEPEAFVIRVSLEETPERMRGAVYVVAKTTWDAWWRQVEGSVKTVSDRPVAQEGGAATLSTARAGGWSSPGSSAAVPCSSDNTWDNGILDDVPNRRADHTAVWTGSVVVVWGGYHEGAFLDTGSRYDPATDTWTPISTADAPSPRSQHTAVWTGSLMIVWGGYDDAANYLQTGGRYDPATDTWTPTWMGNPPTPRSGHTAIWTGSLMVVWGGHTHNFSLNTGGRYDPATDTWTPTSTTNAPPRREYHTAVWTGGPTNAMIVWGGWDSSSSAALSSGGRYDPATDTWTPTSQANAPYLRCNHTAVWTGSRMVVWGGQDQYANLFNTGGRYDPATDTWTQTSTTNAPSAREIHTAVWTGSLMVVWGGYDGANYFNTGGRYDPATDTWTPISTANAPSPRFQHTAVWTGALMVVWGGHYSPSQYYFNTGGRYDPATDTWTPTSTTNAPTARDKHTAVWTGSLMVVWGGDGYPDRADLSSGGRYDPATDTWTPTSTTNAPSARSGHTAVWTGSLMVVWGGWGDVNSLNSGGRYDPTTDTWTSTSTANAPAARVFHTAIWTGSLMVVWGGYDGSYYFNTGGRYDPATDTWTPTSTAVAPIARKYHTAVWTGGVMVVWGGLGNLVNLLNTGGRYDPATDTWTPTSTTNAPTARQYHTAVGTGRLMVVWGGDPRSSVLDTGGQYEPATDTWTPTSTTNAPSARSGHTAVWTGSLMVVWGGYDGANTGGRYDPATDTWTPTSTTNAPAANTDHRAVWTGSSMIIWGGWSDWGSGGRLIIADLSDHDADGVPVCGGDCNDDDPTVYPGAPQLCDGKNNNCSDPSWPTVPANEADADGDGWRVCAGDCADNDPAVYPGAPPVCDGKNNNCSDPSWPTVPANEADADRDGWSICAGDCADNDQTVYPGAPQVCDGKNNNCSDASWPTVPANEADADGDGWRICAGDCNDADRTVYPHAPQLCDGKNNNCLDPSWPTVPSAETDPDGDGWTQCAGDCKPYNATVYPNAPEINDGADNQCPGDVGYGEIDEVDPSWFANATDFSWAEQPLATLYEVGRSNDARFTSGCTFARSATPPWHDPQAPPAGHGFFYLVRALTPHQGSWGQNSAGVERSGGCLAETSCTDGVDNDGNGLVDCADPGCGQNAACIHTFSFTDTFADDVASNALYQFFSGFQVDAGAYILFQIYNPNGGGVQVNAWCSERADMYRAWYLAYAPTTGSQVTGSWAIWIRYGDSTSNWFRDYGSSYTNGFGRACNGGVRAYTWCSQDNLYALPYRTVDPGRSAGLACEIYDASTTGCGNGTWQLTIRIAPTRLAACGF